MQNANGTAPAALTRGGFLKLAAFAAASPCAAQAPADFGAEKLRIGVLADVHVTNARQVPYFEKALRAFDAWKCDGVLCCGDLADYGLKEELALVADAWFRTFPGGKGADGRPVANLLHYGDHDMSTSYAGRPEAVALVGAGRDPKASLLFPGDARKRVWEECFHEPWQRLAVKNVKGYTFVLNHFDRGVPGNKYGDNAPGVEELLAGLDLDPAKPFFYSQHRAIRGTNFGYAPPTVRKTWGEDEGDTTRIFAKHPNLVAFTGHLHRNAADERGVWQGAFTAVAVPSLCYNCTRAGRENGYSLDDRPPTPPYLLMDQLKSHDDANHQALFMTVFEKAIVLRRVNLSFDVPLGPDWVIPLASFALPPEKKPFAPAVRAKTLGAPQFAPGARVTVKRGTCKDRAGNAHEALWVSFPAATAPWADDYSVRLELRRGDAVRVLSEHRVFSPRYLQGPARDVEPVRCPFPLEELPAADPAKPTSAAAAGALRFAVRPASAFGVEGEAIATPWSKSFQATDELGRT